MRSSLFHGSRPLQRQEIIIGTARSVNHRVDALDARVTLGLHLNGRSDHFVTFLESLDLRKRDQREPSVQRRSDPLIRTLVTLVTLCYGL